MCIHHHEKYAKADQWFLLARAVLYFQGRYLVGSLSIAAVGHIALGDIAREGDIIDNTGPNGPLRRR